MYFTRRPVYIYETSLSSSQNQKCFNEELYRKWHEFHVQFLFSKIVTFVR